MIHLFTVITENYIDVATEFLTSVQVLRNIHPMCICVNFDPDIIKTRFNIDAYLLKINTNRLKLYNGILQHGEWLDAKYKFNNEDTYIVADSDAVVQRDLTEQEIARFSGYDDNTAGLGLNESLVDNYDREIDRLLPKCDNVKTIIEMQYGPLNRIVYNSGLIVAKKKLFENLKKWFDEDWVKFSPLFTYSAKTQLLQNIVLSNNNVHIDLLERQIHTNGHFPLPKLAYWDGHILRYDNEVVFFRHNFPITHAKMKFYTS